MRHMFISAVTAAALTVGIYVNDAAAGKADDTLIVALNKEIQTLDSLYSTKRETIILGHLVSDQLVVLDPATNEYKPALAESYKFIDDTTVEFKLRSGVKFHDGSDVTADDIIYSFDWIVNKESKSRRGNFVRKWLKGAEKVDANTIRVSAKAPYPLMLRDIAMFVQTRKKDIYKGAEGFDLKAQTQSIVGTGPYKVVGFDMGKGVTLEKFDGYYANSPKGTNGAKTIVMRPIPEWGTVAAEMMSGGVDWSFNVPDDIAGDLGSTPLVDHVTGPSTRIAYLILDAKGASGEGNPLTKLKVRQAMNHAVNRDALVKYLVKGSSKVIHGPCWPGMFGCKLDVTKYEFDAAKAKALLAEAGYPDGFTFDMWAYREKPISEAVAADLANVGIKANVRYVKLSALVKARKKGETNAIHATWGYYGTPDIGAISNHFVPKSDRNFTGNSEVGKLFDGALKTRDNEARAVDYAKAQTIIADQAYWVPLYQYTQNYVVAKDVDFTAPLDGIPRLNEIAWK